VIDDIIASVIYDIIRSERKIWGGS